VVSIGLVYPMDAGQQRSTLTAQKNQPVRAQSVVFPNGTDSIAERTDTKESVNLQDHIVGNPVMTPKPAVNSLFKKIKTLTGPVPAFISHGSELTEDVRAFVFTNGKLQDGLLGVFHGAHHFPRLNQIPAQRR